MEDRPPRRGRSAGAIDEMRQILESYARKGVPQDLFDAAKRSEIASAEFHRNSIPGSGFRLVGCARRRGPQLSR